MTQLAEDKGIHLENYSRLAEAVEAGPSWVDELRKNIEALPPDAYETMSYYERWVTSITQTMIQRGLITTEELARKMADVERRG